MLVISPLGNVCLVEPDVPNHQCWVSRPAELNDKQFFYGSEIEKENNWLLSEGFIALAVGKIDVQLTNEEKEELWNILNQNT